MHPNGRPSITRRAAAVALLRVAAGAAGLGDVLLRPRDVSLAGPEGGGEEALVERLLTSGSELRADLRLADGSSFWAQIDGSQARELELHEGQIVVVSLGAQAGVRELPRAA